MGSCPVAATIVARLVAQRQGTGRCHAYGACGVLSWQITGKSVQCLGGLVVREGSAAVIGRFSISAPLQVLPRVGLLSDRARWPSMS